MADPRITSFETPMSSKQEEQQSRDGVANLAASHNTNTAPRSLRYPAPEFQIPSSITTAIPQNLRCSAPEFQTPSSFTTNSDVLNGPATSTANQASGSGIISETVTSWTRSSDIHNTTPQWSATGNANLASSSEAIPETVQSWSRAMPEQPSSLPEPDPIDTSTLDQLAQYYPVIYGIAWNTWGRYAWPIAVQYPVDRAPEKVCPFVPRTFLDFLRHTIKMNKAHIKELARLNALKQLYAAQEFPPWVLPEAVGGKQFGTCYQGDYGPGSYSLDPPTRGVVLGQRTIWTTMRPVHGPPWRPNPGWPSDPELKWEGDQRVASENGLYGRFPPLPREPAEHVVDWSQCKVMKPYPFDVMWNVPDMDDVYLPVDGVFLKDVPMLLNSDILEEIDKDYTPVNPKIYSTQGINIGAVHSAKLLNMSEPFGGNQATAPNVI